MTPDDLARLQAIFRDEMSGRIEAIYPQLNRSRQVLESIFPQFFDQLPEIMGKYQHLLEQRNRWERRNLEFEVFRLHGWTNAPSMAPDLRVAVSQLNDPNLGFDVDRLIIDFYRDDDYRRLRKAVSIWPNSSYLKPWSHVISDALEAHVAECYTLTIPALVPIIEYVLRGWRRDIPSQAKGIETKSYHDRLIKSVFGDDPGQHAANTWFACKLKRFL